MKFSDIVLGAITWTVVLAVTLVTAFAIAAGLSVVFGITFSVLWGWFMVPIFGLPKLSAAQAVAVSTVYGFFTQQPSDKDAEAAQVQGAKDPEVFKKISRGLFKPIARALSTLLFAYLLKTLFL